ncbi:tetratricopeptide (TPR) repeat protein [Dysgonomonas sp. PH5-45]|uniref:hypothetical protein n=1 Tax=unclassified Dysgonomonas TaxID=2630389 RepID=UPI0024741C5E|nr:MULTISPECIES: hypothetical protein [unclassified Dysgonomonas]MDH6353694.1 tetratricopeptide (TPR) repeat protein [Dysgonomonas sp. PH5-45]MDH6386597.1 tetratricopeptide (TPR) repeat protein [Dysgonomonas sp. PH5-37]
MKKISFIFCLSIVFYFFTSCNKKSDKFEEILGTVEYFIDHTPDSALIFLDSIHNPYELKEDQHAKYILLLVQAKDKNFLDISSENLIFQAKDYFIKNNEKKNICLSAFYCGRVLQSQKKFDNAVINYLEAKNIAVTINDYYLCGLCDFFIGEISYNQLLFDEAIRYSKKAEYNFLRCNKYKNRIASNNCIANSFLLKKLPDSAFVYYEKGLGLAKSNNDLTAQIDVMHNMGLAFQMINEDDRAKEISMQALSLCSDNDQKAKHCMSLSRIYIHENKKDSALFYSILALDLSDDDLSKASIYRQLSKIEENSGNYRGGLDYHKLYSKSLSSTFEEKENFHILNVLKKYDFELLQNANKKLVIERLWIVIISIVVIALGTFMFIGYELKIKKHY